MVGVPAYVKPLNLGSKIFLTRVLAFLVKSSNPSTFGKDVYEGSSIVLGIMCKHAFVV